MKRLLLLAAAGLLSPVIGCSDEAPNPDEATSLPPEAAAQIEALLAEKEARTPAQRKISSQLLYAKSGRFAASLAETKDPDNQIRSLAQTDSLGRVMMDIKGDVNTIRERVEALGGAVIGTSKVHNSARVWLSVDRAEDLAASPSVTRVNPAFMATTNRANNPRTIGNPKRTVGSYIDRVAAMQRAQSAWMERTASAVGTPVTNFAPPLITGAVLSEGVKAHAVDRAQKLFNSAGDGVTVGVLSDSDDGREQSIATGDLPPDTVSLPGQDGRPGSGEGTAMMEIVHDVAPNAKIVFATAFISPESFADNIRRLRFEAGADVIVDDIIYFFESPYQDDIIAQAVNDVVADGAIFVSSAGNQGNANDGTTGTWEGDYRSAGVLSTLPSGYTVHNFGAGVISNRIELTGGPLFLHWSDAGTLEAPASFNDYDLFLLDNNLRNVVLASTDLQDGAGLPFEFLGFIIPPGFRVVIAARPNAEVRAVRTLLFAGELGIGTSGSTYGHSSAAGAISAAAVDAAEASGGEFFGGPTTPVELFSADGVRRVFYNADGSEITPGRLTFASNGGQTRIKPDAAGADGVSTTLPPFSGLNPFFGTSAAAPHIAGIAALIKSAAPTLSAAQIRNGLVTGGLDIESVGIDRDAGGGLVFAPTALQRAGAPFAAFLERNNLILTPIGSDVVLPGGSATLRVQLINNGGARAQTVTAVLSSSTPGVTVTQPNSTYPTVFPGATATNPTLFRFSVDPSVPCGTLLQFTLAVSFVGVGDNPTLIKFGIQTGRPGGAATTFSFTGPPVAIPDADPNGISIPFTFPLTGGISSLSFRVDGATCNADIGSTTVGIDHTWVGDLAVSIAAPSGKEISLINQIQNGTGNNSGNNFCQTALVDGAPNPIQNVAIAQAPFTGTFAPQNPQAGFAGEEASGAWSLNVADNALFDIGSVRAFSVTVTGFSCTPTP